MVSVRFGHHPVPQEVYQGNQMPVTDLTSATATAEILFDFLDHMISIQHQSYPRMPGEKRHERVLQTVIAIAEQMHSPPQQVVVEQERQHEAAKSGCELLEL